MMKMDMNMEVKEVNVDEVNQEIQTFMNQFKSAILGTLDLEQQIYLSTLPVVKAENKFYAYISRTAPHYKHLQANQKVQIIFAEDEAKTENNYLRKRVSFNCTAKFLADDDKIFAKLQAVHGPIIEMLQKLDFELVELTTIDGKAIFGAGQAYFLDNNAMFTSQDVGNHNPHK